MWGAGWAFVLIVGSIVTIILFGQNGNTERIDVNAEKIAAHEIQMNKSIHRVEQTLTIMSINQKRQMRDAGLEYIDPERVDHGGWDD